MIRYEYLQDIEGLVVEFDKDLTNFSTMKLVATGDLFTITSIEALCQTLRALTEHNQNYRLLGLGANQLLLKQGDRPYIRLSFGLEEDYLTLPRDEYHLPASLNIAKLTAHASRFELKGWEGLTGIPATLGGAIFMNAGTALGEIGPLVKDVQIVNKKGELRTENINESSFSYRKNNFLEEGDVVVSATLTHFGVEEGLREKIRDYLKKRNDTQPMKAATCGCVFKNYKKETKEGVETCAAGKCIDIIGMKGYEFKNLRISPIHANFMENLGGASADDVLEFIKMIQDKVEEEFGFRLETEVQFKRK